MSEENKLFLQIDNLTKSTAEGKISWLKPNPTTFSWTSQLPEKGTIQATIQKAQRRILTMPQVKTSFILLIRNMSTPEIYLHTDSLQSPEFETPLRQLFTTIERSYVDKGATIIDELLKGRS